MQKLPLHVIGASVLQQANKRRQTWSKRIPVPHAVANSAAQFCIVDNSPACITKLKDVGEGLFFALKKKKINTPANPSISQLGPPA
jgi:hypothetical protein